MANGEMVRMANNGKYLKLEVDQGVVELASLGFFKTQVFYSIVSQ